MSTLRVRASRRRLTGRPHPFDDLPDGPLRLLDATAAGERQPKSAVARLVVSAGEDQITEPGEPDQCLAPGTERETETREFGQSASDSGRLGR